MDKVSFPKLMKARYEEMEAFIGVLEAKGVSHQRLTDSSIYDLVGLVNSMPEGVLCYSNDTTSVFVNGFMELFQNAGDYNNINTVRSAMRSMSRKLAAFLVEDPKAIALYSRRVIAPLNVLVESRDFLTDLCDKGLENDQLLALSYRGFKPRDGLCGYIDRSRLELFEQRLLKSFFKKYCHSLGLNPHYPVCLTPEYDGEYAEQLYDDNVIKWGSEDYGQARWKFTVGLRDYIQENFIK